MLAVPWLLIREINITEDSPQMSRIQWDEVVQAFATYRITQ